MLKESLLILFTALSVAVTFSDSAEQKEGSILTRGLFTAQGPVKNECPNRVSLPSVKIGNTCYYIVNSFQVDWYAALRYCRSVGLKLARILSKEEQDSIIFQIRKMGLEKTDFWISGSDLGSEGKFVWFEYDQPMLYENWVQGNPNELVNQGTEGEDCLELLHDYSHQWNSRHCAQKRSFICELR